MIVSGPITVHHITVGAALARASDGSPCAWQTAYDVVTNHGRSLTITMGEGLTRFGLEHIIYFAYGSNHIISQSKINSIDFVATYSEVVRMKMK